MKAAIIGMHEMDEFVPFHKRCRTSECDKLIFQWKGYAW